MARQKGFKLSDEQKARMRAGRKAAKEKASENMIDTEIKIKKVKNEIVIVGYCIDSGWVLPIFPSEKDSFKGKTYSSVKEAKEAL